MAVPKHRKSKARRNTRRSHVRQENAPPSRSTCSRCGGSHLPHRVCVQCGYYRDREVISMDQA